jgi:hypothetical protein
VNKDDVCIIRAKLKKDYVYDAIKHYGYKIFTPYKGNGLLLRILREVWFRAKLPGKSLWFRYAKPKTEYKAIILFDPLIQPDYIEWLHNKAPHCRIILSYENRADKTIRPHTVPAYVEKWTYDQDDCKAFDMKWSAPSFFIEYRRKQNINPRYDVLYVGRDKGRAEMLFKLKRRLDSKGLKTYFHICADRQFLRFQKKFYQSVLSYDDYLKLLVNSKAILNIVPEGQTSVTQRELEAVFDGIKCVTNNRGVKNFELYDKSIFFILGEDDLNSIEDFLTCETKIYDEEILQEYEFSRKIQQMLC